MPQATLAANIIKQYIPKVCKGEFAMETYTKKEKMRYLIGLSGQNILYGIITSSFAYYLQFTILVPAMWTGVILSVSRIFDAVKDPIIGAAINRNKYSFKQYLLLMPLPTAVLTILCFCNGIYTPENSTVKNILIILSAFSFYILWEIVFSVGDIPLTAYPSVLTKNKEDSTRLLSLRPVGAIACSIIALIIQPIVFSLAHSFNGTVQENERNSFLVTVTFFSLLGGTLFQLTAIGSKQRVIIKSDTQKNQLKYFVTNPLLRKITVLGILGSLKSITGIVLTPLVTYYFSGKNSALTLFYTALLGAGSLVGLIIAMMTVPHLTKKHGTKKVYIYVNLLSVIPNVMLFVLYQKYPHNMTDIPQTVIMFILTLIIGSCISISSTIQTLIISEAVDLEEKISGKRPAALFFSVQTFLIKIGTGISSLAASLCYTAIKFSSAEAEALNAYIASGGTPRLDNKYSTLMTALFFLYTVPVAASSLLCTLPFLEQKK